MRFDIDRLKEIVDTLARNRSRTFLTGFGIFWGIFMLLVMLGAGDGLKAMLSKNFEGFTSNAVIMGAAPTSKPYGGFKRDRQWTMDMSDIQAIKSLVPEAGIVTPMLSSWGSDVSYGGRNFAANLKGLDYEYSGVETPEMLFGRWLNQVDCSQERKVCVIGKRVWENIFPDGSDPCGKYLKIKDMQYRIIGVDCRRSAISINGNSDQAVVIPSTLMDKLDRRGGKFDIMCFTVRDGADSQVMQEKIRNLMARRHSLDPTDKSAIMMLDTKKIFSIVDNLFKGVNILVLLVGLGTLLAGAIGVSNIMMVTVKERTTEIGIRRAIGATPKMILSQIITESVGLTVIAGMLGILVSTGVLSLVGKIVSANPENGPVSFQIGFWTAIGVLLLLAVLGILAGLAPAMRAMEIKPVDAMREE
jgi:putative ABC transport system permease protein